MPELEYIEWEDSAGSTGRWLDIQEMKPNQPLHKSVGWIFHEDKKWVVVVPHLSSSPDHAKVLFAGQGEMTIPKSAIVKRKKIKLS